MINLARTFSIPVLLGLLTTSTSAQQPPGPSQVPPRAPTTQGTVASPPRAASPSRAYLGGTAQRRSIVHHYGYPYPGYYHNDQYAGFRNPGGTGRYLEYYPPNNQFQVNPQTDPVKVATFGGGGIPDRNEQLAAQSLGVAKYNAIQGHIDTMARPMWGVGFFGGF
ncbi:MAG: hypothetical protein U0794_15840 [Isosphaeraceae bacterium]